jgi:hypothetical protein
VWATSRVESRLKRDRNFSLVHGLGLFSQLFVVLGNVLQSAPPPRESAHPEMTARTPISSRLSRPDA